MMWWDHDGWGVGDWLVMSLMMVLIWGGVVALAFWLVRATRSPAPKHDGTSAGAPVNRAEELLAERFARGEIDEEEFTRRRKLLHGPPRS